MSTLHPDWNQTDRHAVEVPITIKEEASHTIKQAHSGSADKTRRLAAVVGITGVVVVGMTLVGVGPNILGQVSNEYTISITPEGFDPAEITVKQGETIVWKNEDSNPHMLASNTLCTSGGSCLFSRTLLNGDTESFTIGDIEPGEHSYISTINPDFQGSITVEPGTIIFSSSSSADAMEELHESAPGIAPVIADKRISLMEGESGIAFFPSSVVLKLGETLAIRNALTTGEVISTAESIDGRLDFVTPLLAPGEEYMLTIPEDILIGNETIQTQQSNAVGFLTILHGDASPQNTVRTQESSSSATNTVFQQPEQNPTSVATGNVPQNPFTVGSQTSPFSDRDIQPIQTFTPPPVVHTDPLHAAAAANLGKGKGKPPRNPETGSKGIIAVLTLAFGSLYILRRRSKERTLIAA